MCTPWPRRARQGLAAHRGLCDARPLRHHPTEIPERMLAWNQRLPCGKLHTRVQTRPMTRRHSAGGCSVRRSSWHIARYTLGGTPTVALNWRASALWSEKPHAMLMAPIGALPRS